MSNTHSSGLRPGQVTLLKMALEYLGDRNSDVSHYARKVKSQVDLLQTQGKPLTATEWTQMAQILAVEAMSRDIGAERIAETIYPLVDGLGQVATTLSYIPAHFATNRLLNFAGINPSPQVKQLITNVVVELQRKVTKSRTNQS